MAPRCQPPRWVGGTQDRGEPPHTGAGAVRGSVLPGALVVIWMAQTDWQAPTAPGWLVRPGPGALITSQDGGLEEGYSKSDARLAQI